MIRVSFLLPDGSLRQTEGQEGQTVLSLAQANGVDLEGACEGTMACATCHVVVDKDWYGRLPPASVEEREMLDLAPGRVKKSRLSCQIRLTEALNGLSVRVLVD